MYCIEDRCRRAAVYGLDEPYHCEVHKLGTEVNIIERECKSCGLSQILDIDDKCQYCSIDPASLQKRKLVKQTLVQGWLDANGFNDYDFMDRSLKVEQDAACSLKTRPDFIWDCGTHVVILEVDEEQHKRKQYDCDDIRMININENLMRPTVFIRYNPDPFKIGDKNVKVGWSARMEVLAKWLRYGFDFENVKSTAHIIYLFYDNYDSEEGMQIFR